MMKKETLDLKVRTKAFALRILSLAEALPHSFSGRTIAGQIARSGTSVAANYRAALRARSKAEFISKLSIVHEEADETLFWLELAEESKLVPAIRLQPLKQEADQLIAIFVTSLKTAKSQK